MKLLLIGCGKMGGALYKGWTDRKSFSECVIIDPFLNKTEIPPGYKPGVVIFAVKPQSMDEAVANYAAYAKDALILSIAAGKKISYFEGRFSGQARVIRSMPNTPAAIGKGITVACANKNVSAQDRATADMLLSAVGKVEWTDDENQMDAVTAVSGSGPAYVFLLIEALRDAAIAQGIPAPLAGTLARETVIGSAALAALSPDTPAQKLRENVTSPGGTTAAALKVLMEENGLADLMNTAVAAATKRSKELS